MPVFNMAHIPTQTKFYARSMKAVTLIPAGQECTVCCDECDLSVDVVKTPCNHFFHRQCLVDWFGKQLLDVNRDQAYAPDKGTCPNCRSPLFTVVGLSNRTITSNNWFQKIYVYRGTDFDKIIEEGEQRLEADGGRISRRTSDWVVGELIKIDSTLEAPARAAGFIIPQSLEGTLFRPIPTRQNPVNVDTDPDFHYVDATMRADLQALAHIVSTTVLDAEPNWVAEIDPIRRTYHDYGYPRTNYITNSRLHRLTICAALVAEVGRRAMFNNHVSFLQLLTHAEYLLLEAQRKARRYTATPIQYRRLLDRPDDIDSMGQLDNYSGNRLRVDWIVNLRIRVRGRGANPLGPLVPPTLDPSISGQYYNPFDEESY
ncbi:hypothetical protein P280DRAFT_514943 [Massarina eburnea CBS 473.64]|uniref:RING-type domain-containing protein n=1 Tax=Massarina eburnea CBS 473.64 TaxID=1395130 RepID=A0A6A6SC27_9PLEO|nr:hypothetical protein P280DRAFT_514943 [Massarina eburnea CBS 473.64]